MIAPSLRKPDLVRLNHPSSIINNQSLQAYCRHRAGIDADAAIDAAIGVHLCLATDHADRAARAFADAALAPGAFFLVDFGRHPQTLSKNDLKPLYQRRRNHNASSGDYNRKFANSKQNCLEDSPSRQELKRLASYYVACGIEVSQKVGTTLGQTGLHGRHRLRVELARRADLEDVDQSLPQRLVHHAAIDGPDPVLV